MGLDITAYKNVREVQVAEGNEGEYYFCNTNFIQSNMKNIEDREINIEFDESFDFRAGSYMGYNNFRKALCLAANNITDKELWESQNQELKFYWLINFSDCEGYIGTSYSKILYDEFCKYEDEVKAKFENEYHSATYDNFKKAFELAKDNGLVSFH